MRKSLHLVVLPILLLLITGCSSQDNQIYKYNQILPLDVGNSWTYQVTRYDGFNPNDMMTATSTVKDTVVQAENSESYWVITIETVQSAEILLDVRGNYPAENMLMPAQTKNYWLIVDNNRIIRQEQNLNLNDLQSQSLVEFEFPMKIGSKWSMYNSKDAPLNDEVKEVGSIKVPAGKFSNCFFTEGIIGGTTFGVWLCPGIGIVWRSTEHHGTPFGYKQEIINYSVK